MKTLRRIIPVGVFFNGPLPCKANPKSGDWKFYVTIGNCDKNVDTLIISCKTTSQRHNNLRYFEFIIDDICGRGKTKVQPFNIQRIQVRKLTLYKYIGNLDQAGLLNFEKGLKGLIKSNGVVSSWEKLRIIDSWKPIFKLN